jgi:hypothetical protein
VREIGESWPPSGETAFPQEPLDTDTVDERPETAPRPERSDPESGRAGEADLIGLDEPDDEHCFG